MRVRMLTTSADASGCVLAGEVTTLPDPVAQAMVRDGYAEPVGPVTKPDSPAPATATTEPPEKAATRTQRPKGRGRR